MVSDIPEAILQVLLINYIPKMEDIGGAVKPTSLEASSDGGARTISNEFLTATNFSCGGAFSSSCIGQHKSPISLRPAIQDSYFNGWSWIVDAGSFGT